MDIFSDIQASVAQQTGLSFAKYRFSRDKAHVINVSNIATEF